MRSATLTLALTTSIGLAAAASTGCVQETKGAPPPRLPPTVRQESIPQDLGGQRTTVEETVADSPCAERLHTIGGLLLEYYVVHKELPRRLEDLRPLAGIGEDFGTECPNTKAPYLYVPTGLHLDGKKMQIVVADAEPSHGGKRWCLLMSEKGTRGQLSVDVLLITEPIFRTYLPVAPLPMDPPPQTLPGGG
jgi:hypothetical protein